MSYGLTLRKRRHAVFITIFRETMLLTRKSRLLITLVTAIILSVSLILAIMIGASDISISSTVDGIFYAFGTSDSSPTDVDLQIISEIRIPRALLGATIGAGLAICGLITQSLLRNPLGDPYILGISSGASAGAALVIVVGASNTLLASLGVTLGAFFGALIAIAAVSFLATAGGGASPTRIIFAGMAVSYLFSALTSLIAILAKNAAGTKSVMFWTLGSLGSASWNDVGIASITTSIAFILFFVFGRRIDVLNLGDDSARALGTHPAFYRNLLFIIVAFTIAVLVSLTGAIGFIGLVVPHLAKLLVGEMTRCALPLTALLGAILVVNADICTRIMLRPAELPIGILTAIVGTPMLMVLIKKYAS